MISSGAELALSLLCVKQLRTSARRRIVRDLVERHQGFNRLAHYLSSEKVFDAPERWLRNRLSGCEGLKTDIQAVLRSDRVGVLPADSRDFPPLLLETGDAPLSLMLRGELKALAAPCVAIVGARRASPAGLESARYLAYGLARCGLTIVSGLAQGIDSAAHRGALEAGGRTIAVLGNGHAHCYPRNNLTLVREIAESGGLLVSEYPPWEKPRARNFPERNRIISGLSLAVVVVEAAERSGSLITARLALEQGRDVMAVPGPRASSLSKGCHRLLRQGAALVEEPKDILETLDLATRLPVTQPVSAPLEDTEKRVLQAIDYAYTRIDAISSHSGVTHEVLLRVLPGLELKGQVKRFGDGYTRC